MTITPPAVQASPDRAPTRDRAIDLVRALCIVGVVVLHALMVGVTAGEGRVSFVNASEGAAWIVPLSWALQVMPLFFVIGGFSGAVAFRRARARAGTDAGYIACRVHRLVLPAAVAVAAAGAAMAALAAWGVPTDLVTLAGFRFAQPLWFLGVFLVCQALLPFLLRQHERAPVRTIAVLAGAALIVDAARAATGLDALGFLNLAFVWLALQQLGFFLADGRIDVLSRRIRIVWAALAVAGLALSFGSGFHSPDLVANINPPTTALLLVGIVHTSVFSLLRDPLRRIASWRAPAALLSFLAPRAMTVYLWHMPVLLAMAGLTAAVATATGLALPAIGSPLWWLTRPLWLAVALATTALVARGLARVEQASAPAPTASTWRAGLAAGAGAAAVGLLLVVGASVFTAAVAVAVFAVALRVSRTRTLRGRRAGHGRAVVGEGQRIARSFVDGVQVQAHPAP